VSLNVKSIPSTSFKKAKIESLLIVIMLFSSYVQPVKLRKYLRCNYWSWN
jgi:hypothetical protein